MSISAIIYKKVPDAVTILQLSKILRQFYDNMVIICKISDQWFRV